MSARNPIRVEGNGKGLFRHLALLAREVGTAEAAIGVVEPEPVPGSDLSTGQLLAIHEFGSPARNIPSRPVLRLGLAQARDQVKATLRGGLEERLKGGGAGRSSRRKVLYAAARVVQRSVKAQFGSSKLKPAEDPSDTRPLVDTGRLRAAIKIKIVSTQEEEL